MLIWDFRLTESSAVFIMSSSLFFHFFSTFILHLTIPRLILIAEKTTVYEKFPTPLINRLEKHFVLYSSVLENWQSDTLREIEQWIKNFSHVQSSNARFVNKVGPLVIDQWEQVNLVVQLVHYI